MFIKRVQIKIALLSALLFLALCAQGCNSSDTPATTEYEPDYIVTTSDTTVVTIGDLSVDNISVDIENGTFAQPSDIALTVLDEPPAAADAQRFSQAANAIELTLVGADYTRTDKPVKISFRLDEDARTTVEDEGFIQISYYFNGQWYLQPADSVDLDTGIVEASIYHFSPFMPVKLTREEVQAQTAEQLALSEFQRENNISEVQAASRTYLQQIITEATGVTDTAALQALTEYIASDNDFLSLMITADKGDYTAFSTKAAEMVAKKINTAAVIGDNATLIAGAFEAAGYIYEGDAQGAAEAVSKALLNSHPFGKLLTTAIAVTDATIKSWKANGIEEMYQAYKNGAEEGWFGFNVEKGNFEQALEQSSAIERQIHIDAVKSYCNIHGVTEGSLSNEQLEQIKKDAIALLKQQFETRVEQDAQITEKTDYYKNLLEAFEEYGVDDSVKLNDSFDGLTYEERLYRYNTVAQQIFNMTGKKITFSQGLYGEDEIPAYVVASAIKFWYHDPPKEQAIKYLKEEGFLPTVKITELAGTWTGVLTIEEVYFDQALIDMLSAQYSEEDIPEEYAEGCDELSIESIMTEYKAMEGTQQTVSFTITVTGESTIVMQNTDSGEALTCTYNELTGALIPVGDMSSDEGFDTTMTLALSGANPPTITGATVISSKAQTEGEVSVPAGLLRITSVMTLTKGG